MLSKYSEEIINLKKINVGKILYNVIDDFFHEFIMEYLSNKCSETRNNYINQFEIISKINGPNLET